MSYTPPNGYDGSFSVTYEVCNEGLSCCVEASIFVTVNPNPKASASNNGPITCDHPIVTLSANPGGLTYSWTGPNGFSSSLQNPTTTSPGNYTVIITNPDTGCSDMSTTKVTENTVKPEASASNDGPITCDYPTVQLSSGPNGLEYSWIGPNGYTSNVQNPTTTEAGTYTVTVTDPDNGCFDTASTTVGEDTDKPDASVNNEIICFGESATLTAMPATGVSYEWETGETTQSIMVSPGSTKEYSVIVTDLINGCEDEATATVTVKPLPVSGINGPSTICAKEFVQFVADPAGSGSVYEWTFDQGDPATSTGPSALVQWLAPGEYDIILKVTKDGCVNTYTSSIIITQEVIAAAGPDQEICQGGSTILDGSGTIGANYTWTFEAGDPTSIDAGAGSEDADVSPIVTTTYRLTVTQNGCERVDFVTVVVDVDNNPTADAGEDKAV